MGCFIYKTNATFNINKLQISLSIFVSIFNIGTTFLFAPCLITFERIVSLDFIEKQLDNLFFYDYLYLKVICHTFPKRLALVIINIKCNIGKIMGIV